ncbi:MAG: ATP-binding protein [Thermoanaerobaculia bacterium]
MHISSLAKELNPWWLGRDDTWTVPEYRREPFARLQAWLDSDDRQAQVVMGPRQVGKTVLLRQLLRTALGSGWPASNILFFNFKDERLIPKPASPGEVVALMPEPVPGVPRLVICDEVTGAPDWWAWLGRAVDDGLRVVVADSSAATLRAQRLSGDSLAGRWTEVLVEGLSFGEFLALRASGSPQPSAVGPEMEAYLAVGGFPEHVQADSRDESWERMRVDLTARAIGIDLRHQGLDVLRVEQLLAYLIRNSGAQLDERKVSSLLGASRNAVISWLEAIESTLLIRRLESHRTVPIQRLTRGLKPKLYASEPSLVQAFALPSERPGLRATLFEAAVFKLLRQRFRRDQILFVPAMARGKKRTGGEIDFLVDLGDQRLAIEVTTGGTALEKAETLAHRAADFAPAQLLVVTDALPEREHRGVNLLPLHRLLFEPGRYLP